MKKDWQEGDDALRDEIMDRYDPQRDDYLFRMESRKRTQRGLQRAAWIATVLGAAAAIAHYFLF